MNTLSNEAKEIITTLDLVAAHRNHIARRQEANPSPDTGEWGNLVRIEMLQERINELLDNLSNSGYEVEYHDNTTTVLRQGQKWLEKTDWTEYMVEETAQ